MVNASLISRLSHAVDLIEQRSQQNRPWKIVKVRRGFARIGIVARDRHFAAHPEDRGADVRGDTSSERTRLLGNVGPYQSAHSVKLRQTALV